MSVATKIAIQLNCKLGGEVWAVEMPLKGLMVVGIDSYHDSAKKGRSVGAFIASMNKHLTRYYSRCTFQHNMQELMDGLKVCMKGSYQHYVSLIPTRSFAGFFVFESFKCLNMYLKLYPPTSCHRKISRVT